MTRKVVFLDRDGTINVDHGFVIRREDWQLIDGAIEAIRLLRRNGFLVAVVSNQSGVGRGLFSVEEVNTLHKHMSDMLANANADVDAIAFCPHVPDDNCDCRKPATGMARQAEQQLGTSIDYSQSWMIGDKITDLQFGAALGMQCGIIRSRYWDKTNLPFQPQIIGNSLLQVAMAIQPRACLPIQTLRRRSGHRHGWQRTDRQLMVRRRR